MDIGMAELLVIGIVALIVIGPKDLPEMFRQLGRFTAKMRAMAREFSRAMEQAANESGVKDVAKDLQAMTNPKATGMNAVKDAVDKFEKWDPIKNAAKPTVPLANSPLVPPPMPPAIKPPVVAEPAALGPNTSALFEKKAAREAAAKTAANKVAPKVAPLDDPKPESAARPKRAVKTPAVEAAAKAPRKKKTVQE